MLRDDIVEYSLEGHHSEEAGKKIRKKILFVTVLLTAITMFEVGMGMYIKQGDTWSWLITKWVFVGLTLLKAGYIVLVFMHLGDERKALKYVILVPYFIFVIYLIFILLWEALAIGDVWAVAFS